MAGIGQAATPANHSDPALSEASFNVSKPSLEHLSSSYLLPVLLGRRISAHAALSPTDWSGEPHLDPVTIATEGVDAAARDFLAGMTDRYAVALFEELFIPRSWSV